MIWICILDNNYLEYIMRNNEIFDIANGILTFSLGFILFNVTEKSFFNGFGFELSLILFFAGIAIKANYIISCLTGFIGNLAILVGLGVGSSELIKYISGICFFLLGIFSSSSFFLCDIWFIIGLFFSNLIILLLNLSLNLSNYIIVFPYFLVLISLIQILLLYIILKPKSHKDQKFCIKSNPIKYSDYYSSYPPSNLGTFLLFSLYCNNFTQTALTLYLISKHNSTLNPTNLSLSLMASLSTSSLITLLEPLSQIQIKLSILLTTTLSLLIYPLHLYSTNFYLLSSIFLLPYSLKSLSSLKFLIYGVSKSQSESFLPFSSSFGCLFILASSTITSIHPSESSIPILTLPFLSQLACSSLSLFSLSSFILPPHPSFIPISSESDLPLASASHAYSIRKSLQNSLLSQL